MQHERTVNQRQYGRARESCLSVGQDALAKYAWPDKRLSCMSIWTDAVSIRYGPHLIAAICGRPTATSAPPTAETHRELPIGKGGLKQFGRRSFIETGGSASRPPGFNAFGQNCWMGSKP